MNFYRLVFTTKGELTRVPDAQTIFGALCTAIRMKEGHKKLEEYLNSFDENPWFVHSSMFLDELFPPVPTPLVKLTAVQDLMSKFDKNSKLQTLSTLKQVNRYQYFSKNVFRKCVITDRLDSLSQDVLTNTVKLSTINGMNILQYKEETQPLVDLRTFMRTQSGTLTNKTEKDLFYKPAIYVSPDTQFSVYVKSNWSAEQLRPYFSMLEYVGAGPYRSTGMNLFHLEKIEKCDIPKSSGKHDYLLSGCIPVEGEFDFEDSAYKIDSNVFHGSFAVVQHSITGTFTKLKEGSMMKPTKKKEWYGQMLKLKVNGKEIYHYGLGVVA